MEERLIWEQIKEKYPHQYVGMVDIETDVNNASIKSAVVKYTDADTSYDDLVGMHLRGEIKLRYTTLDEDCVLLSPLDYFSSTYPQGDFYVDGTLYIAPYISISEDEGEI